MTEEEAPSAPGTPAPGTPAPEGPVGEVRGSAESGPDGGVLAGVVVLDDPRGQRVLFPSREDYLAVMVDLRRAGFEMCVDLCGVDYLSATSRTLPPGVRGERFEVVVNLLSLSQRRRVRIRVQVPEDDPVVPSLYDLWPGTEAMEREAYDLFGICFAGHPDLTRILLPEDWEGHPLRKDYGVGRVPIQFKEAGVER
jgi:NADH-quinone oxidoreductase subunit C